MLKLNIGLSKKVGQPDFGSLGASCNVELEAESALLEEPGKLQARVRNLFGVVRSAVDEELSQQGQQAGPTSAPTSTPATGNGNGHHASNGHTATDKQLDYARQLAGQIRGLGLRQLDSLANKMFGKPVADLSTLDASGLIDALKDIKAGKIDLASVLNGAAS